ncbi:MAG TPA: hypothetical protein DCF33_10550 [Saprospirales bacterium]|nr:hypothetical protein [Saprospirales bacterium]
MLPSNLITIPFELENVSAQADEAELLALLSDRIEEMLERRPEYLMSLLYRLDVLEEKIRPVMRPDAPEPAHVGLARLVLERQKQRAETKQTIKPDALEGMEGWEW